MDRWDESVFGDEFEDEQELEPTKEQVFFLIDASPAMLEPCEIEEEGRDEDEKDFAGLTWLEAGVKVALHIMKQKIISGGKDELAVILYGTGKSQDGSTTLKEMQNAWLLQPLAQPGAEAVHVLQSFSADWFSSKVGTSADANEQGIGLATAVWAAKKLSGGSKVKAIRRVLIFTRNEKPFERYVKGHDPSQKWKNLQSNMRGLHEMGASVELYPMVPPGQKFDLAPFWRAILLILRGQGAAAEDAGEAPEEEAQQVFRLRDLFTIVRSRAHRKRSVGSLKWTLGPGLTVAVKLHQMTQRQKPGARVKLSAVTGYEVKAATAQIDELTGAQLAAENIRTYFFKKGNRFPKVYITKEELQQIRGTGSRGMTLLGFKPISCLKEHHQIRNSTFVYPDEAAQAGSATCFIALWEAMKERNVMAICRVAATTARVPCLVALLPQEEVLYDDDTQYIPPGLQLIYLPFMDDIRQPEARPEFTGAVRHTPSESQVAAAELLIAELQLTEFDPGSILNPALQRHYEVLESMAAGDEPPLLEDSPIVDLTVPSWEEEPWEGAPQEVVDEISARMSAILGFKDAVGLTDEQPKKAATKRAAAAPVDAEAVAGLGIEEKAAAGGLKTLTNDQLKMWLRQHGLPVSGKKDELIARINNKLGIQL